MNISKQPITITVYGRKHSVSAPCVTYYAHCSMHLPNGAVCEHTEEYTQAQKAALFTPMRTTATVQAMLDSRQFAQSTWDSMCKMLAMRDGFTKWVVSKSEFDKLGAIYQSIRIAPIVKCVQQVYDMATDLVVVQGV